MPSNDDFINDETLEEYEGENLEEELTGTEIANEESNSTYSMPRFFSGTNRKQTEAETSSNEKQNISEKGTPEKKDELPTNEPTIKKTGGLRRNNTQFNGKKPDIRKKSISDMPDKKTLFGGSRKPLLPKTSSSSNINSVGALFSVGKTGSFWKYKFLFFALSIGTVILLLIFFIIISGGIQATNVNTGTNYGKTGYYDPECNYNNTSIEISQCSADDTITATSNISIKEYILGATYAYTKGGNYSEKAIKAMMIVLKTNILSNGNYSNVSKKISIDVCNGNYKYCDLNNGCSSDTNIAPASATYKDELEKLYAEVEDYIYISNAYNSNITSLSSSDSLPFDNSILEQFESLAYTNDFEEILIKTYNEQPTNANTEYIFIGDSRTHGMANTGVINDSNSVYASSKGYSWFVGDVTATSETNAQNGGIVTANSKMTANENYNIIIWLGVNDLGNVNSYFNKYKELASGEWSRHTLYIVSVGPVNDSQSVYAKNETINNFNNTMRTSIANSALSNLKYIELNLDMSSLNSPDGIHYSANDYKNIFNLITNKLNISRDVELALYDMGDFCEFFEISEVNNASYWWPIGSSEPTHGKIYGGEPKYKEISSSFGPRINPVTKEYQAAHGAIDIPAPKGTPVIASQSGTVTLIHTGCVEGDKSCGGKYGNHVKITHDSEIQSLYAHLSQVLVQKGESVMQGQIIGYVGNTGRSTGNHLHFEIYLNGKRVDPEKYVSKTNTRPTEESPKIYVCNRLLQEGFSQNAVIGVMVNMHVESVNFNIKAVGDGGTSYGLCQWHNERWELLKSYRPNSWHTTSGQLDYFMYEIQQIAGYVGVSGTYEYLVGNHSARDMAIEFCKKFESPKNEDVSCPKRPNKKYPKTTKTLLQYYTDFVTNGCKEV